MNHWKSKTWPEEVEALRTILWNCDLDESIKWRKLCYAHQSKNIAIIQEMKGCLALMFFKGSLLTDPKGLLKAPGENSRHGRRFEFQSVAEILKARASIQRFVREAIQLKDAGVSVPKPTKLDLPKELLVRFKREPPLKAAFLGLTPGRQRGYSLYFSAPKGSEARERRIDKFTPKILAGKGFHDR